MEILFLVIFWAEELLIDDLVYKQREEMAKKLPKTKFTLEVNVT